MAEEEGALDGEIHMRVSSKALNLFKKKSENVYGKRYTDFIRELIDSVNQGRVRIIPTEESRKAQEELYNVN